LGIPQFKEHLLMTRRQIIAMAAAAPAWLSTTALPLNATDQGKPRLGGTPTAFAMRSVRPAAAAGVGVRTPAAALALNLPAAVLVRVRLTLSSTAMTSV
jgi:hypothetical protein